MARTKLVDKSANYSRLVAKRLAQARTEAGYFSRQKFCIDNGFDFRTYNRWESGQNLPRLDSFLRICEATGKDPRWFVQ